MQLSQLKETLAKAESFFIDTDEICYHIDTGLKRAMADPDSLNSFKESGYFVVDFSSMNVELDSVFTRKVKTLLSGHFANRLDLVATLEANKFLFKVTKL